MSLMLGKTAIRQAAALLRRLARDSGGNTLMIVAFSLIPILAMIGGGIDMGRGYLSQSRLQQACDAGVLAARKKLGNTVPVTNVPTSDVQTMGNKFFDLNFLSGAYGTTTRTFSMNVESDSSITGTATVTVPTTLMHLFGYSQLPVAVTCQAKINFSNTDIMMVLDTTGSMADTNPGDVKPKIQVLRDTVQAFYTQMEASKGAGARIRYGFVPYSVNVNVGYLLKSGWMVDSWNYHGREPRDKHTNHQEDTYETGSNYISGGFGYGTSFTSTSCPNGDITYTTENYWVDPDGTEHWQILVNGTGYSCSTSPEGTITVQPYTYTNYRYEYWQRKSGKVLVKDYDWHYYAMPQNVSVFKDANPNNTMVGGKITVLMGGSANSASNYDAWFNGCIEERGTYEITDYNNVDLTRALDLDLDTVPTTGNAATQWRPALPDISWEHSLDWGNWNTWPWTPSGDYYGGDFIHGGWSGYGVCPAAAQKLQTMTTSQVTAYLNTLSPAGNTYHDIGMIWGGRLLSPTGIFASENADQPSGPTKRHLIFLTDGLTMPNELTYGAYGIEPLDQRRWNHNSALSQTTMVENRFTVACNEVKKKNITVWVIGFGQTLNPVLSNCAGAGHAFYASDASSLTNIFNTIAASMGDLRVSR